MKLKLFTAAGLIAMTGLVSCGGNNDKDVVDKSIIPTAEEKAASAKNAVTNSTTIPTTANAANVANATPVNMQQPGGSVITTPDGKTLTIPGGGPVAITPVAGQQNNVVMTPAQTQVQPTAPGMNPPHGQPNHRCDIPVGAPLNSKPAAPATVAANAQPQVTMTEVPTKVKTAPGMNPPHGEPGHRCDIAVGAPLNSKPAAANVVTTTSAPAAIAPPPLLTAPKADSTKN